MGAQLFDRGAYFEAHEAWEDEWRIATGERRGLLHGLILLAAALHHRTRGNMGGAKRLLARARAALSALPAICEGIDVDALRSRIQADRLPPDAPGALPWNRMRKD
jgi:predicted metal-dependent hydrolase